MDDTRYKVLLIEDDKIDRVAFKRLVRDENLPYCLPSAEVAQVKTLS